MESPLFTEPHSCCLYHTNAEQATIVAQFLYHGLVRREKVLYITKPWESGVYLKNLPSDEIDIAAAIRSGQVMILTTQETYLQTSPFDPTLMITRLNLETDTALEEGYTGFRVTADMTWALHHRVPPQTLITYETQVDEFLRHSKCTGLCRYDRWHFPSSLLEDILPIHSSIIIRDREYKNPMYHTFADLLHDLDNPPNS
jgi:KaiC/GvpD/RAD55 family RecA-like ATPase